MDFYFLLGDYDFEDGQGLNWKYEIAYAATRQGYPLEIPGDLPEGHLVSYRPAGEG
jgi:hypothetical protein